MSEVTDQNIFRREEHLTFCLVTYYLSFFFRGECYTDFVIAVIKYSFYTDCKLSSMSPLHPRDGGLPFLISLGKKYLLPRGLTMPRLKDLPGNPVTQITIHILAPRILSPRMSHISINYSAPRCGWTWRVHLFPLCHFKHRPGCDFLLESIIH